MVEITLFPASLQLGTLIRRYKRFLADITLDNGTPITAHCTNSGAMLGVQAPGSMVWVSHTPSATRKHPWTWELIQTDNTLIGINTGHPNRIVAQALAARQIPELAAYSTIRREATVGQSRLDFLLTEPGLPDCYVEVKNCHLRRGDLLEFPDSVTSRGAKHLHELATLARQGVRAVMLYLGQRNDCVAFAIAADIDPAYGAAFAEARAAGVEMLCYACDMQTSGIRISRPLPVR
jgi:sugar fermentation stimulation protein A